MLRWEEDTSVEKDLLALEKVFRERYHYHTDKWAIPTVPNPSIKLGVQMASFLDNARPDHLLIIYYAGHGYVGPDNQLYWAWWVQLCARLLSSVLTPFVQQRARRCRKVEMGWRPLLV
jgi:hypothetical protein